jgi:pullulanase
MRILFTTILLGLFMNVHAQSPDFSKYPVYHGDDLGLTYTPAISSFKIWSPVAEVVELAFYAQPVGGEALMRTEMLRGENGTWKSSIKGDQQGLYYAFRVRVKGKWSREVPDPYAKLIGTNGMRAVVGDLRRTDPPEWANDKSPVFHADNGSMGDMPGSATDAVIYELHVRDASIHPSSGVRNKGKFIGLTERGTRNKSGLATGLDHLKEFGITHVHLLPSYDFFTVDESRLDSQQYNWGYDPLNYNAPEGSYSTDPSDGITRVREFKRLVKSFHDAGLRVVMDVVYNHTMFTETSLFNQLVPDYYYRQQSDGSFSDASACGNETASERPMMRKFILESVKYWVNEYHVDGFRFDLMGIHDIETMNILSKELHNIKPDILLYGEGWTAKGSPLPDSVRALKKNVRDLDRIAVFSDDLRDGIKGSVFVHEERGFVSGQPGMEETIKFGVVASTPHPQVDFSKVNYSKAPYSNNPQQVISYAECHDNHILRDKLAISARGSGMQELEDMQRLANTIVLTAQGIPFLHAGSEFLRSKSGVENSFNSGDSINAIDWDLKTKHRDVYEYIRALIKMRREHPAFRMKTAEQISRHLTFREDLPAQMVGYTIDGKALGDNWKEVMVVFNGSEKQRDISIPKGSWKVYVAGNKIAKSRTASGLVSVQPYSAWIFYRK